MITGLASAIFVDATTQTEIKKAHLNLEACGLFVQRKDGSFFKVAIPEDCVAFQIGQASQVATDGALIATPHLVKGIQMAHVARNTFAVFIQPPNDFCLKKDYTFGQFTQEVLQQHYA